MISVLRCKFLKIYEFEKKDKTKGFRLKVLEETDKDMTTHSFFIDNQTALNCKDIVSMQNIAISFELWLTADDIIHYKIKNIVTEK